MIYYKDKKYHFTEFFNETTGTLVRSNVLKNGEETSQVPQMRSFPELIDIGIMGSCEAGKAGICGLAGVDCYQCGATLNEPNMSLSEYERIINQCRGRVFQVALGGAGDPNKHEHFAQILRLTRENKIVPNYTTSGYELTDEEIFYTKKFCGAVAISYYSKLDTYGNESNPTTISAIKRFIDAGCITNVHYVLSTKNIKEALYRVEHGLFPNGINAVIFLLYKPIGYASTDYILSFNNKEYIKLLNIVSKNNRSWRYGFDTCQSPAICEYAVDIAKESVEFCEAARFSMYINSHSIAYPCSFGVENYKYSVNLRKSTLKEAWNSKQFSDFRKKQDRICSAYFADGCRGCALGLVQNQCGQPSL